MNPLEVHKEEINQLCKQTGVSSLFAFGSVVTGSFSEDSDIDLLVDISDTDPLTYSEKYFHLKFSLEDLLKRKIDLLESRALKNPYLKKNIEETKRLIYG